MISGAASPAAGFAAALAGGVSTGSGDGARGGFSRNSTSMRTRAAVATSPRRAGWNRHDRAALVAADAKGSAPSTTTARVTFPSLSTPSSTMTFGLPLAPSGDGTAEASSR